MLIKFLYRKIIGTLAIVFLLHTIITATPFGTQNNTLQVRLTTPIANANGGFDLNVELANVGSSPNTLNIDYLEFVVKIAASQQVTINIPGA